MPRPKPASKEMYERRMRPAKRAVVQKEFDEAVKDMAYESLLGSPAMKQYMFEFFVLGWGAKTRQTKRKKKKDRGGVRR